MTNEQFTALQPYEGHFEKALRSSWCPHPGYHALVGISEIYHALTDDPYRTDFGCQHCVLRLMQDTGRMYFAEKEARAKKVTATASKGKTVKSVKVKTQKEAE